MKRIIWIAIILILNNGLLLSQSCLPDGITFNYQAQIDSFPINYPNCNTIEGFVYINGSNIKDLTGLSQIDSIGGDLHIWGNDSLADLTGLEALKRIGGNLRIGIYYAYAQTYNPVLSSLTGLDGLGEIGGSLEVSVNHDLINCEGLENLHTIGGSLYFRNNINMVNLSGLDNLEFIGEDITIGGQLSLIDFTGLEGISHVNGNLILGACSIYVDALQGNGNSSYHGLHNIIQIDGNLELCRLKCCDLSGFDNLTEVGGRLIIRRTSLTSLSGIETLQYVGNGIDLGDWNDWYQATMGNPDLTSVEGLIGVSSIGGGILRIEANYSLTSLSGLDNIDPMTIGQLKIDNFPSPTGDMPVLSHCAIKSICDYLNLPGANAWIAHNDEGCLSIAEVLDSCEASAGVKLFSGKEIKIFPNPSETVLYIEIPDKTLIQTLVLRNSIGQTIREFHNPGETINLAGVSPGIYLIEIRTDLGSLTRKLVITNRFR